MVIGLSLTAGLVAAAEPNGAVRKALASGEYPWYDASADAIRPIWPPAEPRVGPSDWLGDLLIPIVLAGLLGAVVLALLWTWRWYRGASRGEKPVMPRAEGPARVGSLPEDVRTGAADPWAEAQRLRALGDYAGAVVCLFAHQLLALDRIGRVRLAPGRTGRQLVRSVIDADLRGRIGATLRLFEAAYYGRRGPSAEAFAAVWAEAEAFERRVAEGLAP